MPSKKMHYYFTGNQIIYYEFPHNYSSKMCENILKESYTLYVKKIKQLTKNVPKFIHQNSSLYTQCYLEAKKNVIRNYFI